MKKTYFILTTLICGMLQTGCTCEDVPTVEGKGEGNFALSLTADDIKTEVTTRTGEDEQEEGTTPIDVSSFKVSLRNKEGISVFQDKAYSSLTPNDRNLPVDTDYQIEVESCSEEEATTANDGWGQMRFTGKAQFNIENNKTTDLSINCTLKNAGLQIIFDPSYTTKFPTYAVTTVDSRSLTFKSSNKGVTAYYDAPEGSETVPVKLKVTGSKGGWEDRVNKEKDVSIAVGKITKLTIIYDENSGNIDIEFGTDKDTNTDDSDVTVGDTTEE